MKKLFSYIIMALIIISIFGLFSFSGNWPVIYKDEFNKFFGKNWSYEKLADGYDDNLGYTKYGRYGNRYQVGDNVSNWGIESEYGSYIVTNHAHKYNQKDNFLFSNKRRSAKESLWYEFLDISLSKISVNLEEEYISNILGEEYCEAIDIDFSYTSIPSTNFLKYLKKSNWLTINTGLNEFMTCEKQNFEIDISLYDYQYEKLDISQRENVKGWFHSMEKILLDRFGESATFTLVYSPDDYPDDYWRVEYKKGELQLD